MSDLQKAFREHLAQTSPFPLALDIVHAEGCLLRDREGRSYLDLVAGLAVNNFALGQPSLDEVFFALTGRPPEGFDVAGQQQSGGDFFGFGGGGGRRQGPMRGSDLRFDLEMDFEESYTGSEKTIQIPREETCTACNGTRSASGAQPEICGQCRGAGQLRYQQGFLIVSRPCGQCSGTGRIVRNPCQTCRGTGRTTQDRRVTVRIPAGIATGAAA